MINKASGRGTVSLLIVMHLFVSLACASLANGSSTATPRTGVTDSAPAETQAPETTTAAPAETPGLEVTAGSPSDAQAPEEIFVEGDVTFGPGAFDFLAPATGLAELASYKATLGLSFVGTEAGQPSQWSKTYVMLSVLEPLARQLTVESAGQLAEAEPVFMAEAAGTAYERLGANACSAAVLDPAYLLAEQMEPASFLTGVFGAEAAGDEVVGGVTARRYTFDERALGELGVAESTGELWVAADGGYLLQYRLATTGGADYFGEGIEGTLTWDYALTEVNQPLTLALPADCPAGMLDAPLMPAAVDVLSEPGLVSYTTSATPAEVAAFYQAQLPELGWQPVDDGVVVENLALQEFNRAEHQLTLMVLAGTAGTDVTLVVGSVVP